MIQYGNMNPFAGLTDAVATGMQLGRLNRRSEIEVSDPDQVIAKSAKPVPTFDTTPFTKDIESQNKKYSTVKSEVEKTYGIEEDEQRAMAYAKYGINDPLVYGAAKNGINPKMIEGLVKDIKNGKLKDADATAGLMLEQIGSETAEGQAFKAKIEQMKTAYKSYTEEAMKAAEENEKIKKFAYKGALDTIREIKDDPRKFLDPKSGRPSESVVNLLKNEAKYMSGLGPDGYAEYMNSKQAETKRGYKPDYEYRIDENGRLGVFVNGKLDTSQSHPGFTLTGSTVTNNVDLINSLLTGAPGTKGQKNVEGDLKKLYPKGTKLTQKDQIYIIQQLGSKEKAKIFSKENELIEP